MKKILIFSFIFGFSCSYNNDKKVYESNKNLKKLAYISIFSALLNQGSCLSNIFDTSLERCSDSSFLSLDNYHENGLLQKWYNENLIWSKKINNTNILKSIAITYLKNDLLLWLTQNDSNTFISELTCNGNIDGTNMILNDKNLLPENMYYKDNEVSIYGKFNKNNKTNFFVINYIPRRGFSLPKIKDSYYYELPEKYEIDELIKFDNDYHIAGKINNSFFWGNLKLNSSLNIFNNLHEDHYINSIPFKDNRFQILGTLINKDSKHKIFHLIFNKTSNYSEYHEYYLNNKNLSLTDFFIKNNTIYLLGNIENQNNFFQGFFMSINDKNGLEIDCSVLKNNDSNIFNKFYMYNRNFAVLGKILNLTFLKIFKKNDECLRNIKIYFKEKNISFFKDMINIKKYPLNVSLIQVKVGLEELKRNNTEICIPKITNVTSKKKNIFLYGSMVFAGTTCICGILCIIKKCIDTKNSVKDKIIIKDRDKTQIPKISIPGKLSMVRSIAADENDTIENELSENEKNMVMINKHYYENNYVGGELVNKNQDQDIDEIRQDSKIISQTTPTRDVTTNYSNSNLFRTPYSLPTFNISNTPSNCDIQEKKPHFPIFNISQFSNKITNTVSEKKFDKEISKNLKLSQKIYKNQSSKNIEKHDKDKEDIKDESFSENEKKNTPVFKDRISVRDSVQLKKNNGKLAKTLGLEPNEEYTEFNVKEVTNSNEKAKKIKIEEE